LQNKAAASRRYQIEEKITPKIIAINYLTPNMHPPGKTLLSWVNTKSNIKTM
jgi:hypothetical protein